MTCTNAHRLTNKCIRTHYTHIYVLTRAKCSFSKAHQRANKHTDEPLQPQNPFITSRCGEETEVACHVLHSVYKPLKPCPTPNERQVQSVSNPVPIWANLPWASFAFVLQISEG